MKERVNRFLASYGSPLLLLAAGLLLAIWPSTVGTVVCYVLGAALLVMGALRLWAYFQERRMNAALILCWNLAVGVVLCAIGLFFLLQPEIVLSILPVMLGILVLLGAISKGLRALELWRLEAPRWWAALLAAAVTAGAGLFLLLWPLASVVAMIRLVGICLAASALADLWLSHWANGAHLPRDRGSLL